MKKQYILLIMIWIILYIWYLIVSFKYKEYKIISHIDFIENLNTQMQIAIEDGNNIIWYKQSEAYKKKIQKQELGLKQKWETVLFLTSEETYEKYTNTDNRVIKKIILPNSQESIIEWMSIFQKWIYLVFNKDTR